MSGFTKLFPEIMNSSVWHQPHDTLRVWIYLLAMVGPDGIARVCIPDIAHNCFIALERAQEIVSLFESPDPYSRTPDEEGRRVKRVDGGYFLVNYHKYRGMRHDDERREYLRTYMRNYRAEGKDKSRAVNKCKHSKPQLTQAEAEAEADINTSLSSSMTPECPHEEILKLYHQSLPDLPKVKVWTPERQQNLRARWNEEPKRQDLEWWSKYFSYVRESTFLMGNGSKGWVPNLEWLIKKRNLVNVIEGKYHGGPQ